MDHASGVPGRPLREYHSPERYDSEDIQRPQYFGNYRRGVRVGVISDSRTSARKRRRRGDLPSDASIYLGKVNTGSDEARR